VRISGKRPPEREREGEPKGDSIVEKEKGRSREKENNTERSESRRGTPEPGTDQAIGRTVLIYLRILGNTTAEEGLLASCFLPLKSCCRPPRRKTCPRLILWIPSILFFLNLLLFSAKAVVHGFSFIQLPTHLLWEARLFD
jgi:hypothetical protein